MVPNLPSWINFSNINVGRKRAVPSVLVGCIVTAQVWVGKKVVPSLPFWIDSSSISVSRKRAAPSFFAGCSVTVLLWVGKRVFLDSLSGSTLQVLVWVRRRQCVALYCYDLLENISFVYHSMCFASSPRRPDREYKRMVFEHTHGLFIT